MRDGDWDGGEVAEFDEFGFQLFEEFLVFVGGVGDQFAEEFGFLAGRGGLCIWWDGLSVIGSVQRGSVWIGWGDRLGCCWSGLGRRRRRGVGEVRDGGLLCAGFRGGFVGGVGGIDVVDVGVLGACGGEDSVGGEAELAGDGGDGVVVDAMEVGDELGMLCDESIEQGDVTAVVVVAQAGQGGERTVGRELVGEGAKACELFEQRVLRGGGRDVGPVGFEQLEVGVDGGGRGIELLGDVAERATTAAEAMGFEDAGAALGRDVHVRTSVLMCWRH